ncbi:MAG: VWA domain-containing protein [Opitutales bacterium]
MKTPAPFCVRGALAGICLSLAALQSIPSSQAALLPEDVDVTVDFDYALIPAAQPETVILNVGLNPKKLGSAGDRPPVNLALVIDRSGSMGGEKIAAARQGALEAIERLSHNDRLTIVAYDHEATVVYPSGLLDRARASQAIARLQSRGNTNIYAGLQLAAAQSAEYRTAERFDRMILLSDGLANSGPSKPTDFARLGRELADEAISVSTIGLGIDYNEDLMTRLSAAGQGNAYFASKPTELAGIFESEIGDVLNVVGTNATIQVHLSEGEIAGNRVSIDINQLYAEQEKYALVEVALPAHTSGALAMVGEVSVAYDSLANDSRRIQVTTLAHVRASDDMAAIAASVNPEVVRQIAFNETADDQDRAIALFDAGRAADASELLRARVQANATLNEEIQDAALADFNSLFGSQTEAVAADGMDKEARKSLRTESYQVRNQQTIDSN